MARSTFGPALFALCALLALAARPAAALTFSNNCNSAVVVGVHRADRCTDVQTLAPGQSSLEVAQWSLDDGDSVVIAGGDEGDSPDVEIMRPDFRDGRPAGRPLPWRGAADPGCSDFSASQYTFMLTDTSLTDIRLCGRALVEPSPSPAELSPSMDAQLSPSAAGLSPSPSEDNTADFPYLAAVDGPFGTCGGSLVAPGYVLTAAQCVFQNGEAAIAENVTVWVGGEWLPVAAVLVNTDKQDFEGFANPQTTPAWDVAMLSLASPSVAAYVALPSSATPDMGAWVTQTAWKEEGLVVQTAQVNVWDGCPASWTDLMCVGGAGYLQACPADKGSPLLSGTTQVGLASGYGCDGTSSNYGYFTRLSDKAILEQITVWLNSREGTDSWALDDSVRSWLQLANSYLYGSRR